MTEHACVQAPEAVAVVDLPEPGARSGEPVLHRSRMRDRVVRVRIERLDQDAHAPDDEARRSC